MEESRKKHCALSVEMAMRLEFAEGLKLILRSSDEDDAASEPKGFDSSDEEDYENQRDPVGDG